MIEPRDPSAVHRPHATLGVSIPCHRRRDRVQRCQIVRGQLNPDRRGIFFNACGARRARNRNDIRTTCKQPGPQDLKSPSVNRPQEEVDGTLPDLSPVFNALFDGVAEVNPDENPRQPVLVRGLGEARV